MPRPTYAERLAAVGGEVGDLHESETIWIPSRGFAQSARPSATKYHLATDASPSVALCGVTGVSIVQKVIRTAVLNLFGCRDCLKRLEEDIAAWRAEFGEPEPVTPLPISHVAAEPGATAHKWAVDGEPLRNSTSGAGHTFLECPRCTDVILDVVAHRSGTLDVPRNLYSPLGLAWYAQCWACGWRTNDYRNEWDLLEAVKKSRSEP